MTLYVCGFLFDRSGDVALVRKTHGPAAIIGKWNGIGGKIEPGETAVAAMRREFREEAGLDIDTWEHILDLNGTGWCVAFFRASVEKLPESLDYHLNDAGEEIRVGDPSSADVARDLVPNLRWIVPLLMDADIVHAIVLERT